MGIYRLATKVSNIYLLDGITVVRSAVGHMRTKKTYAVRYVGDRFQTFFLDVDLIIHSFAKKISWLVKPSYLYFIFFNLYISQLIYFLSDVDSSVTAHRNSRTTNLDSNSEFSVQLGQIYSTDEMAPNIGEYMLQIIIGH